MHLSRHPFHRRAIRSVCAGLACIAVSFAVTGWIVDAALAGSSSRSHDPAPASGPIVQAPSRPIVFSPDGDLRSDDATIDFTLRDQSHVTLDVLNSEGRRVRRLLAHAWLDRGPIKVVWDGRDSSGVQVPAGVYTTSIVVDSVFGMRSTAQRRLTARTPALSISRFHSDRSAISPNGDHRGERLTAGVTLSRAGRISAAIVRPDGTVVRTLAAGAHHSRGAIAFHWNGRSDAGHRVGDGTYRLVASGSTGAMPTNTIATPVVVDTHAPTASLPSSTISVRSLSSLSAVRIPLKLSEPATITARVSRGRGGAVTVHRPAGSGVLVLDGIHVPRRGLRTSVALTIVDAAGNHRSLRANVRFSAVHPPRRVTPHTTPVASPVTTPITTTPPTDGSPTGIRAQIVTVAQQYLGVPYLWGGTNPAVGLDCSGFVQLVYARVGITLPRIAADQARVGQLITTAQMQPGDLIGYDLTGGHNYIGHIGIYLGGGKMIHASSGSGKVVIVPYAENGYFWRYTAAIRSVL